jgi:hypothetical protein
MCVHVCPAGLVSWLAQKFLLETRFGRGPLRPGGRPQPPRFRPAARDFGGLFSAGHRFAVAAFTA